MSKCDYITDKNKKYEINIG